jgi:transposase
MIPLSYSKEVMNALYDKLDRANRERKPHLVRVIFALIMVGEKHHSLKKIAKRFNITTKTLFHWIKQFMAHGISWLSRQWFKGRGRKSKLTKTQCKKLYEMIKQGPEAHGFECGLWNTTLINILIKLKFSVSYNERYLAHLLKKLGLSYQKACFISDRLENDKHQAKRAKWCNETLPTLMEKAKVGKVIILFGDEVSFAMWGSLGRTWAPKGKQPTVKTTGIRKGLKMFGAIEVMKGDFHYRESLQYRLTQKSFTALKKAGMPLTDVKDLKAALNKEVYRTKEDFFSAVEACLDIDKFQCYQSDILRLAEAAGRFNGESYVEFLKQLLDTYNKPIILIEDGAPYHKSKVVKTFLTSQSEHLTLEPLPAFSPDYNPIEKLWKNTKRDATHLKYFKQFEDLRDSVITAFKSYLNDASKVVCVMSKMRETFGLSS